MAIRFYPALEIEWPSPPGAERIDELIALLDDEQPTAVDERASGVAVFFSSADRRDRALALSRAFAPEATITSISVSDEAWAERSQAALAPIRAGRVIVTPPWARETVPASAGDVVITIVPSMGFGTGHHASTRLCLASMQALDLENRSVLDVGTGSGVLAIAAWRLGAARVVGIDVDADALASARENVELNGAEAAVQLAAFDLAQAPSAFDVGFDLVVANLTGAVIARHSRELLSLVAPRGSLIVSGIQVDEEPAVRRALEEDAAATVSKRIDEDHWVAMHVVRGAHSS